jgi:hypothetical protein
LFDKINIKNLQEISKNSHLESSDISANVDVHFQQFDEEEEEEEGAYIKDSTMLEKKFEINAKKIG